MDQSIARARLAQDLLRDIDELVDTVNIWGKGVSIGDLDEILELASEAEYEFEDEIARVSK